MLISQDHCRWDDQEVAVLFELVHEAICWRLRSIRKTLSVCAGNGSLYPLLGDTTGAISHPHSLQDGIA